MTYIIKGKVISASNEYFDCIDFSKFLVKLYGVNFGSLTELGSGSINVSSNGTFGFNLQNNAPAIVAKLMFINGSEQLVVAQSERFCRHDTIDITFPVDMSKLGGNVFSMIIIKLTELNIPREANNIIAWTADQLSELSCVTCVSIKTLNQFQTAYRLYKEFSEFNSSLYLETLVAVNFIKSRNDIFIPAFFALTGNDFTLSVADLLTHSMNQFISLLKEAGEKREITTGLDSPANVNVLVGSRNALLFNALDNTNYYDAKLIHLAPITYVEKSTLLDNALDGGGLQSIISSNPESNSVPLKKTIPIITLDTHLQHFAPLLRLAINNTQIGSNPDYYSVTLLGVEFWKNPEWPVSPRFSNKEDYANAIYNSLSAGQSTARLSKNLSSSGLENAAVMKTVLDANRNFNIDEHSVSSFFSTESGLPGSIPADMATRLQTLQRSVKLTGDTTDLKATKALIDTNLTSAYAITKKGESAFTELMLTKGISRQASANIYCKSVAMASTVTMLMTQYMRYEQKNALMPSNLVDPVYSDSGGALLNLPDMETLFGSFNACTCSHCESVYSPAAYLTDLLHWLNDSVVCNPSQGGKTGFDALMSMTKGTVVYDRRKDIKYLNLNCKNTNTLLPYIDIVNEILSVNLLPDAGGYPPKNIIDDYKLLQTTKTLEEIMVQPEHRFPAAEALLKTSFFPWTLPYDAGFDEATVYLKELKKPYASLINDFSSKTDQYNTSTWAYGFLLLSSSEAGLINSSKTSDSNFWKKYWGFTPAQLLDTAVAPATPTVGPVLKNAQLTLDELNDVLSAYYINGSTKITIVPSAADACDIDNYKFSPKFTAAIADRLMRFLRLKRKTGLTTKELDLAIFNHGSANGIDTDFLVKLASCMAFAQKYALSFTDVQMLINANAYSDIFLPSMQSSYYKNKLQDPLLPADVIAFFTPGSSTQVFLTNVNNIGNAKKQKLSTVFKVPIPAIKAIIDITLKTTNPVLSLSNLSVIDRYSTLVRIFSIEPSELENTIFLLGDPFNTTTYPDTIKALWNFSEKIKDLNNLSVTATELRNIMEGKGKYELTDSKLNTDSELLRNDIEAAYTKSRLANPAKLFAATPPYLPLVATDETFFASVIIENLRLPFKLSYADTETIINNYSATWLKDYIADPNGTGSSRNSAARKAVFLPIYRLLNRIALLAEITGLKQDAVSKGVDEKIRGLASYPGDHFYWVTNTFSVTNHTDITWIKNMTARAAAIGMSQPGYLDVIKDYHAHHASAYSASNDAKIADFYNLMDEKSDYRSLSVFEFTQTFLRAKTIANPVDDLEEVMKHMDVIFKATKVLNIKVTDAWSWVWNAAWMGYVDVSAFSQDIRRVLNAAYPVFADWSECIVPIQNGFRSRLRDALVAFYIGNKGFADENALYAYYLLDPQMTPCMKTCRIVSVTGSAQLLVHRALLGLEPVCMDADDRNEWEWRKNYRVWEANRKVFLYPENWIDPSLRVNKTALFEEAEGLLQQDEINQENSEKAFAGYLTGLNEVAHLDVRAMHIETLPLTPLPNSATQEVLHVFARTWNPPYIHFYRNRTAQVWSEWEKMDMDIDSDHLIPVIFNRKLYVFFPLFIEKQHKTIKQMIDGELTNAPYLEIKMCYTKLDGGKWQNKKVLNGTLQCGHIASPNIPNTERGLFDKLGASASRGRGDGEIYRGNLVWDDYLKDYSYVSLKQENFYFWPLVDAVTGDININLRRGIHEDYDNYHDGYSEMAYDWGFRIGACDEKLEIVPPKILESGSTDKRFLDRPYMTLPFFQQMKRGRDAVGFNPNAPGADAGLWVKDTHTHAPGSTRYLNKTNGDFVLTYPQQYKDNRWPQPFFYSDKKHSFFISYPSNSLRANVTLSEHPLTCKMLEALNRFGIEGLLNSPNSPGLKRQDIYETFFGAEYSPTPNILTAYPVKDFDFSRTAPYSMYNWEVFFHSVSLIARQLRQNNQFDDAVKWLNYIFDPSNRDVSLLDLRYWKVKPFLMEVKKGIAYYIRLLSAPNLTAAEQKEKADFNTQIEQWRDHPFDPHLIASMRPRAYMLWTVMELVDTLTDWGDFLFRQDTMESINEAINLYIIASEILGTRPKKVDKPAPPDRNYDSIMNGLSAFSNVAVNFENRLTGLDICHCEAAPPASGSVGPCIKTPALTVLPDLLFCIPDNPKLTEMWDRVEDRLYKIRHCMNIDGKVRELALFSPPIDPALLVRATAMGLDLSDVLADLAAPPPHYRFSYLLQRANDFCNEVKSLGSQLLTALEKKDAEELSLFRQVHEQNILKASRAVKQLQIDEAKQNYATLQYSKNLIQIRLNDYSSRQYKNNREDNAITQTGRAEEFMYGAQGVRLLSGLLTLIPDFHGGSVSFVKVIGGDKFGNFLNAGASALEIISSVNRNKASMSLTYAGYDRRQEEWELQKKMATEELVQVDRQLLSAEIRIAVTEKELENHDLQAEQSAEIYDWLKTKYTNQALYTWMAGQLKTLHRKAYELAYDMAKLAQQAFFKDLGAGIDTPKINFGNWDSSRAGFFAGERLSIQLKELEASYMQHNTRDYELSKHISLAQLDPFALEQLKATGICDIVLPEVLFNMDYPSHYYRRIRSISLTIPGITGPYTTINATLTLINHKTRKSSLNLATLIAESGFGESIATSNAQNDSGIFELNFKDERYMPFEGKGAISSWRLEFPDIIRQFNFSTIADVVIHMQYTAKDGGATLATLSKAAFINNINTLNLPYREGFYYAINLKHDMPDQWHLLKKNGTVNITIAKNRLPYFAQALNPVIDITTTSSSASRVMVLAESNTLPGATFKVATATANFNQMVNTNYFKADFGLTISGLMLDTPINIMSNLATGNNFSDLIIIVKIKLS